MSPGNVGGESVETKNLKNKTQFDKIKKSKNKFFGETMFLQAKNRKDECEYLGIGYVVTSKNGNAVRRNKIRRRISEAIRVINKQNKMPDSIKGHDIVVVGKKEILEAKWDKLVNEVKTGINVLANKTTKVQKHTKKIADKKITEMTGGKNNGQ